MNFFDKITPMHAWSNFIMNNIICKVSSWSLDHHSVLENTVSHKCLGEFHWIFSLDTLGDKDEPIRFSGPMVKGQGYCQAK